MFKTYNKEKILKIAKDMDQLAAKWAFKALIRCALTGVAIGFGVGKIVNASAEYGAFIGKRRALQVIADNIEDGNNENS